jgi:hypothetical protein
MTLDRERRVLGIAALVACTGLVSYLLASVATCQPVGEVAFGLGLLGVAVLPTLGLVMLRPGLPRVTAVVIAIVVFVLGPLLLYGLMLLAAWQLSGCFG